MTVLDTLAASPHRALFLSGAIQTVATMAWWLLILAGRLGGSAILPEPAVAAAAGHVWLMLYGLLPFFVFGFLFTAMPNWLETGPIPRRRYVATAALMSVGAALFYPGLYLPGLAIVAVLLHLAGWGVGLTALLASLRASGEPDRRHSWAAWAALVMGWLGGAACLGWLMGDAPWLLTLAVQLGVWGFLTPLFLVVCHRMIPWFTSRVVANYVMIRPYGALWIMLAASLGHGALIGSGQTGWTWLADLPLAALALWFTSRWGIARSFGVRLLAMLHIAFVWAALAFVLFALDSLATVMGWPVAFGLAPLHALAIGFFGSMLIGMASRVSLGHSGRKLEADNFTWALFWLVQGVAVVRMLPELLAAPYVLIVVSAALWLLAFMPWAGRYGTYYWRPRADGKPG
ncbi:MAG: NnrS family protein [Hydrogenophilaceae bacterium]